MSESQPASTESPPPASPNRFWLEMGPVLLFTVLLLAMDVYWATGAFMVAQPIATGITYKREGSVPPVMIVTLVMVLVFGGLTLFLQDDRFIKVKVTVVHVFFGVALLTGLAFKRSFLQLFLGTVVQMNDVGWRILTTRYAFLMFGIALANEVLWRMLSTKTWGVVKFLGILAATFLFLLSQARLMQEHAIEQESSEPAG